MSGPDPILLAALRRLMREQARLEAAGVTPHDLEAWLRAETGNKYGLSDAKKVISGIDPSINARNVGRSFLQGVLMDWGDELGGAVFGDDFKEDMRLRQDMFRSQHGTADMIAGMAGGVTSGLAAAPFTGGGSLAAGIAKGAATGAVAGGLTGAGHAEGGFKERTNAAALPAALGMGMGALVPAAVGTGRLALSPAARAERRLASAVGRSGGVTALEQRAGEFRNAGKGGEVMLGDLSPHLRAEMDFAANTADDVRVPLEDRVAARHADAAARLGQDAESFLGGAPDAEARLGELEGRRIQFANGPDGFEGLRENNAAIDADQVNQALAPLLQHPTIQAAWQQAARLRLLPPKAPAGVSSFAELQSLKMRLDSAVGALYKQGLVPDAQQLSRARDAVVQIAEQFADGYAGVNARYAGMHRLEEAVRRGMSAWGESDSRALVREVGAMAPEELTELRSALASQLLAKLRGAASNRDQAQELMVASRAMQDKLRIVFGDEDTFRAFMERVGMERDMARMRGAYGGSSTARRTAAQTMDPMEMASAAQGGPAAMASVGMRAGKTALARNTARQLGPMLMTQGADQIDEFLRRFRLRPPTVGAGASTVAPMTFGGLFGRM